MQFATSFVVVAASFFGMAAAAPAAPAEQLIERAPGVTCKVVSPPGYVLKFNADCEACRHDPRYPAFTDTRDGSGHRILVLDAKANDKTPAGPEEFVFEACTSKYMNLPAQNGTTFAGHVRSTRATDFCITLDGTSRNGRFTSQRCSYADDDSQERQFFVWDHSGNQGTENYLGVVPQPSQDGKLTQQIAQDTYIHNAYQLFIGDTPQEKVGWRTSTTTTPYKITDYLRLADPSNY